MHAGRLLLTLLCPLVALLSLAATSAAAVAPARPAAQAVPAIVYAAAPSAPPTAPSRYVEETGHNLGGPFKAFYDGHGGAAAFGNPITEELSEEGLIVQYFERARLEQHVDGTITLARLGSLLTDGRTDTPFRPPATVPPDRTLIPDTGHTMGGVFRTFWEQSGAVPLFGNPISEEFIEQVGDQPMLVQYFERTRLEYLPLGNGGDGKPQIGALGALYAQRLPAGLRERARPLILLGEERLSYAPQSKAAINIALAAARFDGLVIFPGYSLSFVDTVGEVSTAMGYQTGQIVAQGTVAEDVGGGICFVSTGLYRAALRAGLEILTRKNHGLYLSAFSSEPGLDAAVFTPSLDMRWRNDTPYPITIAATASNGQLVVSLWGMSDGRVTQIDAPIYTERSDAGPAVWRFDATLAAGAVKWVTRGGGGMVVTRNRIVKAPDGRVLHQDAIVSRYAPWRGLALYGAGVTPPADAPTN